MDDAIAGRPLSFESVLDARFGRDRRKNFDALRSWAERPTPRELELHFLRLPDGPDGAVRRLPRDPCWENDLKGKTRAMTVAASVSNRKTAEAAWKKVEEAFRIAQMREVQNVARARSKSPPPPTTLAAELAVRVGRDQAWRTAQYDNEHDEQTGEAILWRFSSRLCHIDTDNLRFLKMMIERNQWPTITVDGEQAAKDAWLLAQHADADLALQEEILTLLKPLVARGDALGANYALLFDRVATAKKLPQRYGTQFTESSAGCLAALPIEDPTNVDRRRASVGLPPLAEYAARLSREYRQKTCEDPLHGTAPADAPSVSRKSAGK